MFKQEYKLIVTSDSVQAFLLAMSPILHMYRFFSIVTWGEVALCLATLISMMTVRSQKSRYVMNYIAAIVTYFLFSTILGTFLWSNEIFTPMKEYIVFAIYYIVAFFLIHRMNTETFLAVYKKIALLTACVVIVQFVFFATFGIHVSGLIPNMTTYYGNSTNFYINSATSRCAGFFTEPAMCARYLSIPFILHIDKLSKTDKKWIDIPAMILAAALLFTLSGNGIIALVVGVGIYVLRSLHKITFKSLFRAIALAVAVTVLVAFLYRQPLFNRLFSRIQEIGGGSTMKSGYIRIVRGFVAYFNLPFPGMIFGVGFGNYETVVQNYLWEILTSETDLIPYWINGIQDYFIYGGIIGAALFIGLLWNCWKRGKGFQRFVLILFIVYLFMAGMMGQPQWVIFMVIICSGFSEEISLRKEI